jgi:hypothetical protein
MKEAAQLRRPRASTCWFLLGVGASNSDGASPPRPQWQQITKRERKWPASVNRRALIFWAIKRRSCVAAAYLRVAHIYMLISMPTDTSRIFGAFQAICRPFLTG